VYSPHILRPTRLLLALVSLLDAMAAALLLLLLAPERLRFAPVGRISCELPAAKLVIFSLE